MGTITMVTALMGVSSIKSSLNLVDEHDSPLNSLNVSSTCLRLNIKGNAHTKKLGKMTTSDKT